MSLPHDAAVDRIAAAVKAFYDRREPFRVFHGSTNSTRPAHGAKVVDISALSNILEVNTASQTVIVEPNVPMDKLVQAMLAHGLVPPVVMEFPGITVGGGFAGSAGESSSFRHGYFSQTVKSIEMVLATGEVVRASPDENAALFHGAGGSAGTLGIVTQLELGLVPAKRFVKLTYHCHSTVDATITAVREATEATGPEANDYVDAILFSPTLGVVMTGVGTDEAPPPFIRPRTFSGPWDPWFYLHAQHQATSSSSPSPVVDYIPLAEYLFRYDRGAFWAGALAFAYFPFIPFTRVTRWLLNDFFHTRMLYRALQGNSATASAAASITTTPSKTKTKMSLPLNQIIHDLSLPYPTSAALIAHLTTSLPIWPLWLCPLRATAGPTFHPSHASPAGTPEPMLNIGVWDRSPAARTPGEFAARNRALEQKLAELGGKKVLYSHVYYGEDEFWGLYDRPWYEGLREKYGAGTLPTVFDKVHVDLGGLVGEEKAEGEKGLVLRGNQREGWRARVLAQWPGPGVVGIVSAIRSRDYLIHRQPCWTYWKGG